MSFTILLFAAVFLGTFTPDPQPEELGHVEWLRDFDLAIKESREQDKPIFLLFQEVPGCATCRNYGQEVLSHPLIVEVIETYFIPMAVYNNKGGKDREVLEYYKEPSWNNPVVRIVNKEKKDIYPRIGGNYSALAVVQAIVQTLDQQNLVVPNYLYLLQEELQARVLGVETTALSMYCFWTGEKELGKMDGVIATEPGFMHGREVVLVEYNPEVLPYEKLLRAGKRTQCADQAFTNKSGEQVTAEKILGVKAVKGLGSYRADKDNKYYLSRTDYRCIPMIDIQAVKVNARIGAHQSPDDLLSPRQLALLEQVRESQPSKWGNVIGEDMKEVWW